MKTFETAQSHIEDTVIYTNTSNVTDPSKDARVQRDGQSPKVYISIDKDGIITAVQDRDEGTDNMVSLLSEKIKEHKDVDEGPEVIPGDRSFVEIMCEIVEQDDNDDEDLDSSDDIHDITGNHSTTDDHNLSDEDISGHNFSILGDNKKHSGIIGTGNERGDDSVPDNETYDCPICGKRLTREYYLQGHMVSLHSVGCTDCNIVNYETEPWTDSTKATDERQILCMSCDKPLILRSKVGPKKIITSNQGDIQKADGFQTTDEGYYMCTICGKMAQRKNDCLNHQLTHKNEKTRICHICGQNYSVEASLRKHLKDVHGKVTKKGIIIDDETKKTLKENVNTEVDDDMDPDFEAGDGDAENDPDYVVDDSHYDDYDDFEDKDDEICYNVKGRAVKIHAGYKETARETFDCKICGKKLTNEYSFKGHMVAVHTVGCLDCLTVNVEKEPWAEDVKASNRREIACNHCNKTLILSSQAGNKSKGNISKLGGGYKRLDNGMHMCLECGKLFLRRVDCRDHQLSHIEAKNFQCQICQQKYGSETSLRKHLKEAHGKRLKKKADCEEVFDMEELNADKRVLGDSEILVSATNHDKSEGDIWGDSEEHEGSSVKFDWDEYLSFGLGNKKEDKKKKMVFGGENYECTECSKFFGTEMQFRKHLKIVHLAKHKAECKICKKKFKKKSELVNHNYHLHMLMCLSCMTVNTETEPWPNNDFSFNTRLITCTGCGKSNKLNNKPGPKSFKITKEGGLFRDLPDRGFGCLECGKVFLTPNQCKRHKSVHVEEKTKKCPHCPNAYKSDEKLKIHMNNTHTEN